MEQITCDFLKSNLTESDFFGVSSKDLISLKEHLLRLKAKDQEFLTAVKPHIDSMKEKCGWLDEIAFSATQHDGTGEYLRTAIWLFPTEGRSLITHYDVKTKRYRDIAERVPKLYILLNKSIRTSVEREKELVSVQEELREIDELGRLLYDGVLYARKSVSGNFCITYTPNIGMNVWWRDELVANYYIRKMKLYDRPYLSEEEKGQVLTRIQLKK